jgi:hypothetical protein
MPHGPHEGHLQHSYGCMPVVRLIVVQMLVWTVSPNATDCAQLHHVADARWNPACDANKVHEWLVTPAAQIGPYMLHVHASQVQGDLPPLGYWVARHMIQTALQAASIRFPDLISICTQTRCRSRIKVINIKASARFYCNAACQPFAQCMHCHERQHRALWQYTNHAERHPTHLTF